MGLKIFKTALASPELRRAGMNKVVKGLLGLGLGVLALVVYSGVSQAQDQIGGGDTVCMAVYPCHEAGKYKDHLKSEYGDQSNPCYEYFRRQCKFDAPFNIGSCSAEVAEIEDLEGERLALDITVMKQSERIQDLELQLKQARKIMARLRRKV